MSNHARSRAPHVRLVFSWGMVLVGSVFYSSSCHASEPVRPALWVDVLSGEPITLPDLIDDLATARVVYLGERHSVQRHHNLQLQIVAELAERQVPLVLGLEQLEAIHQSTLDRYGRGEIDFDELARTVKWSENWRNYEQYRPVLEAARRARAPILALNARSSTIRAVFRGGGVEKLAADLRGELPEKMELDDPAYAKLLGIMLSVHLAATPEWMQPMMEAQIARDEHMAHTLSAYLNSPAGEGRTAVVLVGSGHVNYGLGLAARVRTRMPKVTDRIVIMSESGDVELSEAERAASQEIEVTHAQLQALARPIADYLHVVSPKQRAPEPVLPDSESGGPEQSRP